MRKSAVLTWPSRVLLPIAGLALACAFAYGRLTSDLFGISALLGLVVVTGFSAVIVAGFRVNDVAPVVEADPGPPGLQEVVAVPTPGGAAWPVMGAAAITLCLLGLVLGPVSLYFGLGVGAAAAAGWLAQVSAESTGREFNLLPLSLPVVALFTVASVMFFMSRILLAVPEAASTFIALVVALLVMGTGTFFSFRPSISPRTLVSALAIGGVALTGGGIVAAAAGERDIHHEEHGGAVELTALNTAFEPTDLTVPQGKGTIEFSNQDPGVPHNVALFEGADAQGKLVFRGDIVTGPAKATYHFDTAAPGVYFFHCDVHPNAMKGTLQVVEEAGGSHGEPGAAPKDEGGVHSGESPLKEPSAPGSATVPAAGGGPDTAVGDAVHGMAP